MAISRRSSAAIGGAVLASWAAVIVDAVHRKHWDGVSPWRHFAAAFFLFTAVGALGGGLAALALRLGDVLTRVVERRLPRFARWVEPLLLGAASGGGLFTTAFWAFSGARIQRSPVAKWGPWVLVVVFALAGAFVAMFLRWAAPRVRAPRRARLAVVFAALASLAIVKVDLSVYPTLYTRFHYLLEFAAAFVLAAAFAFLLSSLEEAGRLRESTLRRFAAAVVVVVVGFVLLAGTRRWTEDSLRYAWREPVYVGRMLSRLQTLEGFVRDPRGWRGSTVPSIIALQERYDIDSISLGPEWTDHENAPIPLSDRLLSLRPRASYNIVVFYVDTLRADFARDNRLMPNLSRFAEQSLDFRQAYTTGSDTLHAVPGIIGGSYDLFREPKEDLLHTAKAAGYRTSLVAAQSAREFLGRMLPQFEFDDVTPIPDYTKGNADVWGYGADQPTAARVVDTGIDWLRQNEGTPHLLWLLNFDLHNWREIDESYAQRAADQYGVDKNDPIWRYRVMARAVDTEFGRLLLELQNMGKNEDTVVLFLSDHGEGLGREGFWVHSVFLWQPLIRVPLVLRAPGVPAKVVEDTVSLVDVAPTLARFMAARTPTTHFHGQDLLEYAALPNPKRRHPLVFMSVLNEVPVRLGLIDPSQPHYKLVLPLEGAVPELYDLRTEDPDGRDVSREQPAILLDLLKQLVRAPMFPRPSEPASDGPLDQAAADGRAANETVKAP